MASAEDVFRKLKNKTQALYGAMMKGWIVSTTMNLLTSLASDAGYVKNAKPNEAIKMFTEIERPDVVNLILALNACAQLGTAEALTLVNAIASKMPRSSHSDANLFTSLLDALMKCGDVRGAELEFNKLPHKTHNMYAAMMKGRPVLTKLKPLHCISEL